VRSLTLQNVWLVIASIFPYVKFFRRRPQDRSSFISVFTVRLDCGQIADSLGAFTALTLTH
jgi:hypothetical protein